MTYTSKLRNGFMVVALALPVALLPAAPALAYWDHWHGGVYVGIGGYYPPYPGYYYPGYYPYYAPPPVVYAQPPVVYTAPATVVSAPAPQPPPLAANQASATYTDSSGHTCREYQADTTINGVQQPAYGTACLQPDGTWRVVQ